MIANLPKQHISLTRATEFISVCQQLFASTPITFVYYGILGNDRKNTCMINRPDWHEFYWGKSNFTQNMQVRIKEGINYWLTSQPLSEQNRCAKQYFNIDNKLEIVKKVDDGYEMLGFGSAADNIAALNFYLNHIEKLKRFSLYFQDKCTTLYKEMLRSENRISLCEPITQLTTENNAQFNVIKKIQNIEQLSQQEVKVLFYTISGFNAKEIGQNLNISYKTVNSYLDRIRIKTNCCTKADMVKFAKLRHLMDIPDYE